MVARTVGKRDRNEEKKATVKLLSEMFGISRQAYHQRVSSEQKNAIQNKIVIQLIVPYRKQMPRLGTKKLYCLIKPDLEKMNIKIGRDKFFELMRYENLLVRKKKNFTRTTNSFHRFKKHKNLIKHIEVKHPEQVWVSDITYIRTEDKFEYLSLITDYYSKRIVGYYLADNMKTESTIKALEMAIKFRKYPNRKLIHHSDRGFQYCSNEYTKMLKDNRIKISMTEVYDPYENAIAERVNGILKDEFDIGEGFVNHVQAVKEIKYAIETYNTKRPHLSCNMMTPEQAHVNGKFKIKKWGGMKSYNKKKLQVAI